MRDYIIATDSDSELLYSYAQEMKIPVFAMPVTMDGKDYDFDLDIEGKFPTFFEDLKNGSKVSTSAKSPWEVKQWFLELLESGKDILYIGFSNQLSIHFSNCIGGYAEHFCRTIAFDSPCVKVKGGGQKPGGSSRIFGR